MARKIIEIEYKNEVRDLIITFDLIERVRRHVPWEEMMAHWNYSPNWAMGARFVYLNMIEAGFKDVNVEEIYDEIQKPGNRGGYKDLIDEIIEGYVPRSLLEDAQPVKKKSVKKTSKKRAK